MGVSGEEETAINFFDRGTLIFSAEEERNIGWQGMSREWISVGERRVHLVITYTTLEKKLSREPPSQDELANLT